jgi:protein-S-isoprenylcysteine O-methyltransferase Ste14
MRVIRLLALATDSIFILLAFYFVLIYARSLFVATEPYSYLIYQTFILAYLLTALALILIRKRALAFSQKIRDYVYSLVSLGSPIFLRTVTNNGASVVGDSLEYIGAILVLGAFLSLNKSFGIAPENRGVKTSGLYRIIRHPMYLGYVLAETGFVISNFSFVNGFILLISISFLILRLQAEERLLREDPAYQAYARRILWKLIPFLF